MSNPSPFVSADRLGLTLPDGRRIFGDLTLALASERTGLVGANGVGKTLLLDLLAGVRDPSEGTVTRTGRVAYVRQSGGRASAPRTSVVADRLGVRTRLAALRRVLGGGADQADYDLVGDDGWDLPERIHAVLDRVGLGHLPLDRALASVSGGESTRLALAGALLRRPDLLILDEPTNDLDAPSRSKLLEMLEQHSGGLLVVSHDREVLRRVDRIVELTPDGLREYGGAYDLYREARGRERAAAEAELEQAEAARKKVRAGAREARERQARRSARGRRSRSEGGVPKIVLNAMRNRSEGSTAKLGRVMDQADERATARVTAARKRVDDAPPLRMDVAPSGVPAGKDVLVLEDLAYTPPGSAHPLFEGIDLVVRGPERVAVTGPNGSGKSTLLRLVMGGLSPDRGRVRLGVPPESVAWLDQAVELLRSGETVLAAFRRLHPSWDESHARHVLARYLFAGEAALAPVDRLSGGERMRAGLACVLGGPVAPPLLVLDEPTNHLDFPSLETVERAVAEFDGALLVVSHDPDFLEAVGVGRRVALNRGNGRSSVSFDAPRQPGGVGRG